MIYKAWSLAQRGRYVDEDKPGAPTRQQMELQRERGISNSLTTVQKDAMVVILTDAESKEVEAVDASDF